ncbi:MAG: hypothetical protein IKQ51_11490 [Bacteroidaceae bacterium]|nr:hypothetical protein [Bacteroidaceae bacterium]
MLAIELIRYAEQGITADIQPALILCYGIDKGIAGQRLPTECMTVYRLQQMQRTIRLILHQRLCLTDNLHFTTICTCHNGKDSQQKQTYPYPVFHYS